jgi:hypothetical protein
MKAKSAPLSVKTDPVDNPRFLMPLLCALSHEQLPEKALSRRLLKNAQIQGARPFLSASGGPRSET